jgi:hypothetical protein
MRVLGGILIRRMAFQADFVAVSVRPKLVVRPFDQLTGIGTGLVHLMASQAAHLAPLIASGVDQPVVLTPGDADHTVAVERLIQLMFHIDFLAKDQVPVW